MVNVSLEQSFKVHLKATKMHKKLAVCFGFKGIRSLCMTSITD